MSKLNENFLLIWLYLEYYASLRLSFLFYIPRYTDKRVYSTKHQWKGIEVSRGQNNLQKSKNKNIINHCNCLVQNKYLKKCIRPNAYLLQRNKIFFILKFNTMENCFNNMKYYTIKDTIFISSALTWIMCKIIFSPSQFHKINNFNLILKNTYYEALLV